MVVFALCTTKKSPTSVEKYILGKLELCLSGRILFFLREPRHRGHQDSEDRQKHGTPVISRLGGYPEIKHVRKCFSMWSFQSDVGCWTCESTWGTGSACNMIIRTVRWWARARASHENRRRHYSRAITEFPRLADASHRRRNVSRPLSPVLLYFTTYIHSSAPPRTSSVTAFSTRSPVRRCANICHVVIFRRWYACERPTCETNATSKTKTKQKRNETKYTNDARKSSTNGCVGVRGCSYTASSQSGTDDDDRA